MERSGKNKSEAEWEDEAKQQKFPNNVDVGVAAVAAILAFPVLAVMKTYYDNSSEKATLENAAPPVQEESEDESDEESRPGAPQQGNNPDEGDTFSYEVSPRPDGYDFQPYNDETAQKSSGRGGNIFKDIRDKFRKSPSNAQSKGKTANTPENREDDGILATPSQRANEENAEANGKENEDDSEMIELTQYHYPEDG